MTERDDLPASHHDLTRAVWIKSSLSGGQHECVEVAFLNDGVAVRNSKRRDAGVTFFSPSEWQAFIRGVKLGEFDHADGSAAH